MSVASHDLFNMKLRTCIDTGFDVNNVNKKHIKKSIGSLKEALPTIVWETASNLACPNEIEWLF
jgi:hypothetical protein